MHKHLRNTGIGLISASAVLAVGLAAGCQQVSPQEKAQQLIRECAGEADEYLDPQWTGRQVTGVYPGADGMVEDVLTARGISVKVSCSVDAAYYTHYLGPLYKIEGVVPVPGQLYLPAQHRWLTDAELHTRLTEMLAPRPGEYAGARWAPNPPAVSPVSDLAGIPNTNCFTLQSKLEPARELVACQVAAGHRYWVSQGGVSEGPLNLEVSVPPAGLPPIPPAPPADLATQPGGVPH